MLRSTFYISEVIATGRLLAFGSRWLLPLLLLVSACSQSSEAFLERGRTLLREQRYAEAVEFLNKAIERDDNNFEAFNARGVAFFELKKYQEAQLDYDRAIELNANFYKPYYNRARVRTAQKNLSGALDDYNRAIVLQPDSAELYFDRGYVLFEFGELKYGQVNKMNTIAAKTAMAAQADSSMKEALENFDKAILLNPRDENYYYNRGTVKARLQDFPGAILDFRQSIRLNSNFAKGYYSLGMSELLQKKPQDGCLHLEQAQKLGYPEAAKAIETYCANKQKGIQ